MSQSAPSPPLSSRSWTKAADGTEILDWDGPNDRRNPLQWSNARKYALVTIVLLGTLVIPLNGTAITIASDEIAADFHVKDDAWFTNTYWIVTSWSTGGGLFVLFLLPLVEELGVRVVYLTLYVFFILMIIPQAVAQNFATLVVTRFFSGGCVAVLSNTIASILPDLWAREHERSSAVSYYILLYLVGNTAGPPIFAEVVPAMHGNWRWIFYIQLIVYCALLPLFALGVKETRPDIILSRLARKVRKETGQQVYGPGERDPVPRWRRVTKAQLRPLILMFTEPLLFFCTLWSAFAFGTVFIFTQSVEFVFQEAYGWNQAQCGWVQAAVVIGQCIGWFAHRYANYLHLASSKRNKETPGEPIPEARLYVAVFGSFLGLSGGMFVYAWTANSGLPWIGPAIGLAMVGFGTMVVVAGAADYVIDAYAPSTYAGSAISAAAASETFAAAFLPLSTQAMYTRLDIHWASTTLALIAFVLGFGAFMLIIFGPWMRRNSPSNRKGREELIQEEKL